MITGGNTKIATNYYQPRQGGDMAVVRGMSKAIFAADDAARTAGESAIIDYDFIAEHAVEFEAYRDAVEATSWESILDQSGLTRAEIEEAARIYMNAGSVIATGHGRHPASPLRHHGSRNHQLHVAARQYRPPRCRSLPGTRPFQRSG